MCNKTGSTIKLSALLQAAVVSFLLGVVGTTQAATMPAMTKHVSLNAREIGVDQFLQQLFGQLGVPVVVDPRISGTVNGDWNDSANRLLDKTLKSFQLVAYYDGAMAYIYNDRDVAQVMLSVQSGVAQRISRQARQLGLPDSYNRLRVVGDSGLQVTGTPRFVEQIKEISVSIRSTKKQYKPQVVEKLFYLKHAWAQDTNMEIGGQMVPVQGMVSILTELLSTAPIGGTTAGGSTPSTGGLTSMQEEGQLTSVNGAKAGSAQSSSLVRRVNTRSSSAKNVRIVAVPRLNAVLIRDYENHMANYQSLIDSLDVEPYMLEIEATIIDIDARNSQEIGVNWRAQDNKFNEGLVGNGSATDQLLRPNTNITPQGTGGILSLALGDQRAKFLARIRALEETGDAEIISKPHVVTLSNVEALLDTTQSYFVRVAAKEDASLFKVTVGTTLRVTPHVYKSGPETKIKLMVNIQDGATSDTVVDAIPVIGQSTINTQAIVTAGDSLLVGGMVRESKSTGESKVPLLGDIPGLGSMFRTRTKSGSKVERLFLITPRLAYRKGFVQRMDAPILEGSQQAIVSTSNKRLGLSNSSSNTMPTAAPQQPQITQPRFRQQAPQNGIEAGEPVVPSTAPGNSGLLVGNIQDKLRVPDAPAAKPAAVVTQTRPARKQWSVVSVPSNTTEASSGYSTTTGVSTSTAAKVFRGRNEVIETDASRSNNNTFNSGEWQEVK